MSDLSVTVRVETIRRKMMAGEWFGNATATDLATQWGIEATTMRDHVAEASRQVAALRDSETPEQLEADRIAWLATVNRIVGEALGNTYTYKNKHGEERERAAPDYKAALKGLEMLAAAKGIATTPDAIAITSSIVNATFAILVRVLPPELYMAVMQEFRELELTPSKQLPSGVRVMVERR